jgi:hypothetical protein
MAKAGVAFQFRVSLFDSAGAIVASPTLAAGDVVVVKADDSSANITTLPSVTSASSGVLNVNLSAAEMAGSAGENVSVKFVDASGAEWMSMTIDIPLTASDIDTVDGIVDSILADTGTDGVVLANDAITAAKIAADAIGASELAADAVAEIADAVWDEAIAGHAGAGSFGEEVQSHALSTEIAALNDLSAAEVNTEVDTALADYDGPTHAELISEINDVQGDIAALSIPTAAAIRAEIDANSTQLAAILLDTGTTIPGLIAALNDLSAAQVNAEVVDALATDTYTEPAGVPPDTLALAAKIGFMYAALRNGLNVNASKKTFYSNAGVPQWEKDISDDTVTYSESQANAI